MCLKGRSADSLICQKTERNIIMSNCTVRSSEEIIADLDMARKTDRFSNAAKLFEENLKYTNGEPVKVVIADTTIGRVAEAAACADKFKKEGVDITLTVTPCWCYGAETMDMDPMTIKAVWGFNGTERPGAVYSAPKA